ncbi:MAG: hypothetical protein HYX54_07560 [Chloroflexi bacterium]|nr:hypothetical protein [Chloroflexota bacterium]
MPDVRATIVALGVGLGAGSILTLLWHWPLALGGGIGIVLGGLALVGSVSFGPDQADASAAWRAAAPEFVDPPAGPDAARSPGSVAEAAVDSPSDIGALQTIDRQRTIDQR